MGSWFPQLETEAPELFSLLRSLQPYTGNLWLAGFNKLNNENKHGDLVAQTRVETKTVEVKAPGGGSVSWNPANVKFGKGVHMHGVPIDPSTQMPVPNRKVQTKVTTWVDFQFDGIDESALGLLRQSVAGVTTIAAAVTALLD